MATVYIPPTDIRLEDKAGNFICFSDYKDPALNAWIRAYGQRILIQSLSPLDDKEEK